MLDNSTILITGGTDSFGNTFVPMTRKNAAFLNFEEWVPMVWVWSQTSARQTRFPTPYPSPRGGEVLAAGRAREQAPQGFAGATPLSVGVNLAAPSVRWAAPALTPPWLTHPGLRFTH